MSTYSIPELVYTISLRLCSLPHVAPATPAGGGRKLGLGQRARSSWEEQAQALALAVLTWAAPSGSDRKTLVRYSRPSGTLQDPSPCYHRM